MRLSLKQKITGISLLSILLVASILTWQSSVHLYNENQQDTQTRIDGMSITVSGDISTWLQGKISAVQAVTPFTKDTSTLIPHLVQAYLSGHFDDIYYGAATGQMFDRPERPTTAGYDPRIRDWYMNAAKAQKVVISEPYSDAVTQQLIVTISVPVIENGVLQGVIGADLTLDQLLNKISSLKIGNGGYVMLLSGQDQIIAHPDKELSMQPITKLDPTLSNSRVEELESAGTLRALTINQQNKLMLLQRVPDSDWVLGFVLDEDAELANYRSTRNLLLGISVVLTLLTTIGITLLVGFLFRDLNRVSAALAEIADGEGDLTVRITPRYDDEVGMLAKNFNRFVERLQNILLQMRDIADSLNNQATHTAASAEERTQRIHMQQGEITMVATAVTEMSAATHEIAASADKAATEAGSAVSICHDGREQVVQSQHSIRQLAEEVGVATGVIDELHSHAASISTIMMTIRSIAEQTNLLALNAAIEAARAGDQGRGFAVVADEVRMLSQRTHASTEEIESMINNLQHSTRKAVDIMSGSRNLADTSVNDADTAGNNLIQINDVVTVINDMAAQIATAAEEQSSVTEEITRNTESIKEVAQDLAQEASDAARQAAELSELAFHLRQEVNRFIL
ncbi:methyl-accepting chemotaxis protein [Plesiomonas shigelloides]|uniref:methyl-accepting chemotaxis protein n=1 Tax=Plesiomonas shigelloides TaxID=703 RepID=UPI001261A918|nr:methyl-accepting chemotaxis protein [Plesiomonas shigelloides]KAB7678295.1 HAMP domain-containing protein [Plesiomonas shigelloides]KAB7685914.1 HAMP domain-containing protein [Plesiomonas shigelloides]MCQ8857849.1 methyl-accepting chemotaxis protein [Plesiomonas shigelloides]